MNFPKISIVTPTFNQGSFIEETIKSVVNQRYPNLEFIIIDGGSNDNTIEILKKYEDYIDYWVSEPDSGQSEAINKGIVKCTGKVFNWLNSDDLLEEGVLLKIGEEFKKSDVTLVTGVTKILEVETGEFSLYTPELHSTLSKTISRPCFHQPSTYILTKFVKQFKGVSNLLHFAMDTELYTKYLLTLGLNGVVVLDIPIATFRIHEKSKTGSSFNLFVKDIASIFHSISIQNGEQEFAEKIKVISNNLILENYEFTFDFSETDKGVVKSVLENYIYKYINMYYDGSLSNMLKSKNLLKNFNGTNLSIIDKLILEKIRKRTNYIYVSWLIKKFLTIFDR